MYLSRKQKAFSEIFCAFLKCALNFYDFKKTSLITVVFPKLRPPKDVVKQMSKKSRFKGTLDRQHGKCAETLCQSEQ